MPQNEPLRVLFVSGEPLNTATTRYRCQHLADALALADGGEAATGEVAWTGQSRITFAHDVVVFHNVGLSGYGETLYNAARASGARAVLFSTDDLTCSRAYAFHAGINRPDDPTYYHVRRSKMYDFLRMQVATDGCLVSTESLGDWVPQTKGNDEEPYPTWVIRNFLGAQMCRLLQKAKGKINGNAPQGRVTLSYLSGTPTHDRDLADIAAPLARVMARFEDVNLLMVGAVRLPPELEPFVSRIRRHPFVDWRDLPYLIIPVHINLVPLDISQPFNHAKSELKWLEAAAVGVPSVVAATESFGEVITHNRHALVAWKRQDWETQLERMINDPDLRTQIACNASRTVWETATAEAVAPQVLAVFEEAVAGKEKTEIKPVTVRRPFSLKESLQKAEAQFFRKWVGMKRHFARMMAVAEGRE